MCINRIKWYGKLNITGDLFIILRFRALRISDINGMKLA